MRVDMTTFLNTGNAFADVMSVFNNGIVLVDWSQGDFVPYGNCVNALHLDRLVVLHHPTCEHLPTLDSFDDNNADGVLSFVNKKMRSSQKILQ